MAPTRHFKKHKRSHPNGGHGVSPNPHHPSHIFKRKHVRHATGKTSNEDDDGGLHSGLSAKYIKVVASKKVHKTIGAPRKYHGAFGGTVTAVTAGIQAVVGIGSFGSKDQWLATSGTPDGFHVASAYFNLNPNRGNTGSVNSGAATGTTNMDKFVFQRVKFHLQVLNASNVPTQVEIIFYKCITPTDSQPGVVANFDMSTEGMTGLGAAQLVPPAAGTTTGGTYASGYDYATNPYCPILPYQARKLYKVIGKKHMNLGPMAQEILTGSCIMNMMGDYNKLVESPLFFQKGTVVYEIRALGGIVLDTTVATHVPTYSLPLIHYIMNYEKTFRDVRANISRNPYLLANSRLPIPGPAAIATVNIVDGAQAPVVYDA